MEDQYRYHGMEEIFRIDLDTNHEQNFNLDKAHTFGELNRKFRAAFKKNGLALSGKARIESESTGNEWRIVDEDKELIQAYFIKKYSYEEKKWDKKNHERGKKERKYCVFIYRDTPSGRTRELWQEKVFQVGIPFRNKYDDKEEFVRLVTANEDLDGKRFLEKEEEDRKKRRAYYRRELDDEAKSNQKRKWDYFFRPHPYFIGRAQKESIDDLEDQIDELEKEHKKQVIYCGAAAAAIFLLAIFGSGMLYYVLPVVGLFYLFTFMKFQQQKKRKEKWVHSLKNEIQQLYRQVSTDIPSDEQMESWLHQEIKILEDRAIRELMLERDTILKVGDNQNKWDTESSIFMLDWGAIQPQNTNGKGNVDEEHIRGFRVTKRYLPLFSVYYVQFIFLTPDQIAAYSTFYDFILGKTIGATTHQYYYQDVVGIGTVDSQVPNIFDEKSNFDVTLLRISVSNNDPLQIALKSEQVIEDINKRIEENRKYAEKHTGSAHDDPDFLSSTLPDYRQVDPDEENLSTKIALAAMASVRREWARKKEILLNKSNNAL